MLGLAVAIAVLLASCEGGGPAATPSPAPPASPSPTTVQSPTAAAPAIPAAERPITGADVSGTLAAERDGRHLFPVAAYGDEILVDASRDVPPTPGEPVGQGPNAFDQHFLFWNPATGALRAGWTNESARIESVAGIDGNWAVSLLYRLNPANAWSVVARNLRTGEVRDLADEPPQLRGLSGAGLLPVVANGHVVWSAGVIGDGGKPVWRVFVHDLDANETRVVAEAAYVPGGASRFPLWSASTGGSRVAWIARDGDHEWGALVVHDLASGSKTKVVAAGQVTSCTLSGDGGFAACEQAGRFTTNKIAIDKIAIDFASGQVTPIANDDNPLAPAHGGFVATALRADAGHPARVYEFAQRSVQEVSVPFATTHQSVTLLDGWLAWLSFVPDASGRVGSVPRAIFAVRLP